MGTFLSKALGKYYAREGNRVVFKNGMSLNQLALDMWERLGYREIDASVISRVVSGERFFTPSQLDVFCTLLKVPKGEREYLFYCLYRDQCALFCVKLPDFFSPHDEAIDLYENLIQELYRFLYTGQFNDILNLTPHIIESLNNALRGRSYGPSAEKLYDLLGTAISLRSRAVGGFVLPENAFKELLPYGRKILSIAKKARNKKLLAFADQAFSCAYYASGNYSSSSRNKAYFLGAIRFAKKAFSNLSDSHPEKLFALRTLLTCAIFIKDKEMFFALRDDPATHKLMRMRAPSHCVMGIHLYHTIARGEAVFGLPSAWKTHESTFSLFGRGTAGMHVQEVADIRNELEILSILKIKNNGYIKQRINRGLIVAREEGCVRQIKNINKLQERLLG